MQWKSGNKRKLFKTNSPCSSLQIKMRIDFSEAFNKLAYVRVAGWQCPTTWHWKLLYWAEYLESVSEYLDKFKQKLITNRILLMKCIWHASEFVYTKCIWMALVFFSLYCLDSVYDRSAKYTTIDLGSSIHRFNWKLNRLISNKTTTNNRIKPEQLANLTLYHVLWMDFWVLAKSCRLFDQMRHSRDGCIEYIQWKF